MFTIPPEIHISDILYFVHLDARGEVDVKKERFLLRQFGVLSLESKRNDVVRWIRFDGFGQVFRSFMGSVNSTHTATPHFLLCQRTGQVNSMRMSGHGAVPDFCHSQHPT